MEFEGYSIDRPIATAAIIALLFPLSAGVINRFKRMSHGNSFLSIFLLPFACRTLREKGGGRAGCLLSFSPNTRCTPALCSCRAVCTLSRIHHSWLACGTIDTAHQCQGFAFFCLEVWRVQGRATATKLKGVRGTSQPSPKLPSSQMLPGCTLGGDGNLQLSHRLLVIYCDLNI